VVAYANGRWLSGILRSTMRTSAPTALAAADRFSSTRGRSTAAPLLMALESAFKARIGLAIARFSRASTSENEPMPARTNMTRKRRNDSLLPKWTYGPIAGELKGLARLALENCTSFEQNLLFDGVLTRVLADYLAPRPGLWVSVQAMTPSPLSNWHKRWMVCCVADGRSHLATRERFSTVDDLRVLPVFDLPETRAPRLQLRPTDVAVVMTHSFDQDSRILHCYLRSMHCRLFCVLGPQRRTRENCSRKRRACLICLQLRTESTAGLRKCMRPPASISAPTRLLPSRSRSLRRSNRRLPRQQDSRYAKYAIREIPATRAIELEARLISRSLIGQVALPAHPETLPAKPDVLSTPDLSPGSIYRCFGEIQFYKSTAGKFYLGRTRGIGIQLAALQHACGRQQLRAVAKRSNWLPCLIEISITSSTCAFSRKYSGARPPGITSAS